MKLRKEMGTVYVVLNIFLISFLSKYSADSVTDVQNNFALISTVHEYYSTSCVFLVHSRQKNLDESYKIERVIRQFSAQGTLVIGVEFRRLREAVLYYTNRVVKSLIVVSLPTREVIAKFSNLTHFFDMHLSCWLLIFDDKVYLENNITKPGDNLFHLTFDTELIVARTNHSTIQEWYWLRNRVKMEDIGVWDAETGFIPRTRESLYHRRDNLENSLILVTTVNNPPMTSFANNQMGGLFGKIMAQLSVVANFTVQFIPPTELSYGSWNPEKKRWTGMMNMLVSGQASIAAADFSITTLRLEWVDFSLPLISTRDKLYIKQPGGGICWSSYWETLAPGIWVIIQTLILFTTLLLTLTNAVRRYRVTLDVLTGYFLLVFGIYCQQGLPEFPTDLPSRITYFSIFLSALIVSAAYAAALVSFLTVTGLTLPFTTLEEFVADGTYGLIVFRDGAEYDMFTSATEQTLVSMSKMILDRESLPVTFEDGFRQVCRERVAFYVPAAFEESIALTVPCKVIGIETMRSMSLAMALSKHNPYNGLINYHVQRFRDHGILNRLKHDYSTTGENPQEATHDGVTVLGIVPILAVLGGGIILALIILSLEKLFFSKQTRVSAAGKETCIIGSSSSEEILKIRLRNRAKYLPPSSNYCP